MRGPVPGVRAINRKPIKCVVCGRFLNYSDRWAHCNFTPDTAFTTERVEWICGECRQREQNRDKERQEQ